VEDGFYFIELSGEKAFLLQDALFDLWFYTPQKWFGSCSLAVVTFACLAKPRHSSGCAYVLHLGGNHTGDVSIFSNHLAPGISRNRRISST